MNATAYRDDLKVEIQSEAWDSFAHLPRMLGDDDDVARETLALLPDPEGFVTVDDFAAEVRDRLDLTGYVLRETLEGLFDGLAYTRDLIQFQSDHEELCDEAIAELGSFAEVMADCDSMSEVICRAADLGAAKLWRDAVEEFMFGLSMALDRLDEDYDL